jgi:hypothetical protein
MIRVTEEVHKSETCLTYSGVTRFEYRQGLRQSGPRLYRQFLANSWKISKKKRDHEPLLSSPYPFNFQNHLIIRRYIEKESLNIMRINEWGNGGTAPPFLTSALNGGKWSISWAGRFIPGERAFGIHRIGDWLGPRVRLDILFPFPGIERRLQPVAMPTELFRVLYLYN